jgi:hypothetical protein
MHKVCGESASPNIPSQSQRQFMLWTNRFSDAQIERALTRAHKKFAQTQIKYPLEPSDVHRYVTGVLLNLEREQKQQTETAQWGRFG